MLAREVVVELPDGSLAERRPAELRERLRQEDERSLRGAESRRDVVRIEVRRILVPGSGPRGHRALAARPRLGHSCHHAIELETPGSRVRRDNACVDSTQALSACTLVALLGDLERPLHEARVRVAHELVGALLQRDGERLRPALADAGLDVDARPGQVKVVLRRLVGHDELDLRRLGRLGRHLDRESRADGPLVGRRRRDCGQRQREHGHEGRRGDGQSARHLSLLRVWWRMQVHTSVILARIGHCRVGRR